MCSRLSIFCIIHDPFRPFVSFFGIRLPSRLVCETYGTVLNAKGSVMVSGSSYRRVRTSDRGNDMSSENRRQRRDPSSDWVGGRQITLALLSSPPPHFLLAAPFEHPPLNPRMIISRVEASACSFEWKPHVMSYIQILFLEALFETKGRLFECWDQNRGRRLQILLRRNANRIAVENTSRPSIYSNTPHLLLTVGDLCSLHSLLLNMAIAGPNRL